jgi:hypothetical protein
MRRANVHEAETQTLSAAEGVEAGPRLESACAGQPVLDVLALHELEKRRRLGLLSARTELQEDFHELPADIAAVFGAASP